MRLAVSNIAWESREDDGAGAVLRNLGVDAVEIAPTRYWPTPWEATDAALADVRERWRDRGQQIVALQSLLFGQPELSLFGDENQRERTSCYLEGMLRVAAGLGARALVFGSPRNRDRGTRSFEQAVGEAVTFFRPLAAIAADLGCVIAWESNPVRYGCNFCVTVPESLALIDAVDHPGFGLNLDIGILHVNGEGLRETILAARRRTAHVHISEADLAPVGVGFSDHAAAAAALREVGWNGIVSIEMRCAGEGGDSLPWVRNAVQLARGVYLGGT